MYFTDAIVLSRKGIGENDALFSLYTKDFGKIHARAQGIKKEGAKLRGHLEVLNISLIGFVLGKNGERLIYAEARNTLPAMRAKIEFMEKAFYILSLVDKAILPGERDLSLWTLLLASLSRLENEPVPPEFLETFEADFLSCLGYDGERDLSVLGLSAARWV